MKIYLMQATAAIACLAMSLSSQSSAETIHGGGYAAAVSRAVADNADQLSFNLLTLTLKGEVLVPVVDSPSVVGALSDVGPDEIDLIVSLKVALQPSAATVWVIDAD